MWLETEAIIDRNRAVTTRVGEQARPVQAPLVRARVRARRPQRGMRVQDSGQRVEDKFGIIVKSGYYSK